MLWYNASVERNARLQKERPARGTRGDDELFVQCVCVCVCVSRCRAQHPHLDAVNATVTAEILKCRNKKVVLTLTLTLLNDGPSQDIEMASSLNST